MRRAFALLFLFAALPLFGQQPKDDDAILNELFAVRSFEQVAISPDGKSVAWSEEEAGLFVDGKHVSAAIAEKKDLDEREFAWAPDSKRLAFLSDAEKHGQRQLYIVTPGKLAKKVTSLRGYLSNPQWSPDGNSIAFLYIEDAARAAGPLVAMSRAVGEIAEHIEEQRVTILDVASGEMRTVTPDTMYVYEYDWSPDGKQLATVAAPGSGDDNWWIAQLHTVDVAASTMTPIYKPELQIASPRWAPDGKRIAFIEGLMSDQGVTGGDLFVIETGGEGQPRNLTPSAPFSVASLRWSGADELTFGANMTGDSALALVPASGGDAEILFRGSEFITDGGVIGASFSKDGTQSAVIRSSFSNAPEVWAGKTGAWKQVSRSNANVTAHAGEVKKIEWASDQFRPYGWLMAPREVAPAKKHPMVVWIHGGPSSAIVNRWPREEALMLARHGYFVFFPNFRGSYGAGEAFTRANVKDFGYGDLRDILSGVDEVVKSNPIDSDRVGIWGWSYGGYMTMWAVTQTERFKAAVAGAGIANWQSYYGQNDIDSWMIPFFGASVYDDPEVYAKSSPITFIKKVKTPTLILAGERDGEVPAPQSFEFFHALKTLGVPTRLVVYEGEGHRVAKPEHRRDIVRRLIGWFDDNMQ
jgi:dipeptidyl aminopeptidase/acylaminoacyl peptidase